MRNNLKNVQYLLFVLFMFAMTGCGAGNLAGSNNDEPGKITAKFDWAADGKSTAKTVASVPANVVTVRLVITGPRQLPGNTNYTTTKAGFTAPADGGTVAVAVAPGTGLTVNAQALDANDVLLYEGWKRDVTVASGAPTPLGTISLVAPMPHPADVPCLGCHENSRAADGNNLVVEFKNTAHYRRTVSPSSSFNGLEYGSSTGCAGCHTANHKDLKPSTSGRCYNCHTAAGVFPGAHAMPVAIQNKCATCHDPHSLAFAMPSDGEARCTICHSIGQKVTGFVNDNNGVRSITNEFAKWSHHVTGVTLNDAHCAACHLEGKAAAGKITVDTTKHMVDAKTHLRDADTDADFAWDPYAPNHSDMDKYCMSCHDANGAISAGSVDIQAVINTKGLAAYGKIASATNPFGDTISNRYDKMQRPAVVDASSQFNTGNNSHHAVKGPRYSGRTEAAGARQITTNLQRNVDATLPGVRKTIFDAGNFNALYAPLGTDPATVATTGLGDDSTLHCGDCHTVGQWKAGVATNMNGALNTLAIGAHGSNNEYLLRNSLGSDAKHEGSTVDANKVMSYDPTARPYLVCYNCHTFQNYGSIIGGGNPATALLSHAGVSAADPSRCNGTGNTLPFGGYTTGTATDGTQFESRLPSAGTTKTFGNVFGIQCANCHNSGTGNAYGGIHGSANNQNTVDKTVDASVTGGAYIDGMGNTTKIERFLPGLGNAMHVPGTLGGFTGGSVVAIDTTTGPNYTYTTGGISLDTNWEQGVWNAGGAAGAGCYTLGAPGDGAATDALRGPSMTGAGGPATQLFDTWGGCDDHGAPQGKGDHGFNKSIIRPTTY